MYGEIETDARKTKLKSYICKDSIGKPMVNIICELPHSSIMKHPLINTCLRATCFISLLLTLISCQDWFQRDISFDTDIQPILDDLSNFVKNEDPTLEEFERYASTLSEYKKSSIKDSILCVTFKDGFTISYDYYGMTAASGPNDFEIDTAALSSVLDSLFSIFYTNPISDIADSEDVITKAHKNNTVELHEKKALYWSPYISIVNNQYVEYGNDNGFIHCAQQYDLLFDWYNRQNYPIQISYDVKFDISDMKLFDQYDIVICDAHGSPGGYIHTPIEKIKEFDKLFPSELCLIREGHFLMPKCEFKLDRKKLDTILPKELSHTIIWNSTCYGGVDSSVFFTACKDKNVADYFGANSICQYTDVFEEFYYFFPKLISGHSTKTAYYSLQGGHNHLATYNLFNFKIHYYYTYRRLGDDNKIVGYKLGIPISAKKTTNKGSSTKAGGEESDDYILNFKFMFPTGMMLSINEVDHGIALLDCSTGKTTYIPVDSKSVDSYMFIEFDDVTCIDIGIIASSLKPNCTYQFGMYEFNSQGEITEYGNRITFRTGNSEVPVPVESVSLNPSEIEFTSLDETYQLIATVLPEDATDKSLEWFSENPEIATVDDNGIVTAIGFGETTITVRTHDGAKEASCRVLVQNGEEAELRAKLIQFYYDTGGPDWKHDDNWCSEKPLEEWYGISFDEQHYMHIDLYGNNLTHGGSLSEIDTLRSVDVSSAWGVNYLEYLDISGCSALEEMNCNDNVLTNLDVSGCSSLIDLRCVSNQLTTLNISGCESLVNLICSFNKISSIDVSSCPSLVLLECAENQLTSINVSGCTSLELLNCASNQLVTLDITNLPYLSAIDCASNPLTTLNVTKCPSLTHIGCHGEVLKNVNVSGCTALTRIYVTTDPWYFADGHGDSIAFLGTVLESFDVSGCTALEYFHIVCPTFATVNVSGCNSLKNLIISGTQLSILDASNLPSLTELSCTSNALTSLNVSGCPSLGLIDCFNNLLTSIDVSGCPSLYRLWCTDNHINQLITIEDKLSTFYHDIKYNYERKWDSTQNKFVTTYTENPYGWYYEGEPEKGYHGR